jgi:hypothetical protein
MEKHTTDGISYPPRGLGRVAAARYLGIGTSKFEEMVAAGEKERTKEAEFIAQHRARKAAISRANKSE